MIAVKIMLPKCTISSRYYANITFIHVPAKAKINDSTCWKSPPVISSSFFGSSQYMTLSAAFIQLFNMEDEEIIELSPKSLQLTLNEPQNSFHIQNLSLQYVAYKVISPNPIIYRFDFPHGVLDPCSSQTINITAVVSSSFNFNGFLNNDSIIVLIHTIDAEHQVEWATQLPDQIQRHTLALEFENSKKIPTYKRITLPNTTLIAQKEFGLPFTEEEKQLALQHCFNQMGKPEDYRVSNHLMVFNFPNHNLHGDAVIIKTKSSYFVLLIYIPAPYLQGQLKYGIEPMSPQQPKKITLPSPQPQPEAPQPQLNLRKVKSSRNPSYIQQQQMSISTQDEPIKTNNQQSDMQDKNLPKSQKGSPKAQQQAQGRQMQNFARAQSPKHESAEPAQRMYRSEIIRNEDLPKFDLKKPIVKSFKNQPQNSTPIIIEPKNSPVLEGQQKFSQQLPIQPNFMRVAVFNAYQPIKMVLIFNDHSYLITVCDKELIKVWSLNLNSEVGMVREHGDLKKCKIEQLHEWPDQNERKFATVGSDQVIRVFSVEQMKQVRELKVEEYSCLTSICFLPDRELVCLGGTPLKQFNIFGSKYPKFRFLKLFNIYTLQETLQYKIPSTESQILNPIVYTDNTSMKHSRLNNILVVTKQYKDKGSGELLFLMIDMDDKCSVILTLNFEQLAIYSVSKIHYLPLRGSFVVVERNDPKSYQENKILVLNVKQLQTEEGLKSGLVCKTFDEPSLVDNNEVYVLPKQEYILKVGGHLVHMIDLKTGGQSNLQISTEIGGNPKNIIMAGRILRIEGEIISVLELSS